MNKNSNAYWKLMISFLISIGFILIPIMIGPIWEVNDDPAIAFLLSRAGNNYSPFQWRGLSVFLNFLYLRLPIIDWWAVCSMVSIWASAFVFVFISFRKFTPWQASLISISLLLILWHTAIYRLNFTRTAVAVSIAGCLLIADSVFVIKFRKVHCFEFVMGSILLLLGASIRNKSAMISLVFLALIGFVRLITDDFRINVAWFKKHCRQITMLCIAAILFLGSWGINQALLTPEQKAYEEYNGLRSAIQDYGSRYPAYADAAQSYEEAGLSEHAYSMFSSWFSEDTDVYTVDVLENVSALGTKTPTPDFSAILHGQKLLTFVVLLLMFSVSLLRKQNWLRSFFVGCMMILLCLYLALTGRIPSRVYQSLLLATSATAVFLSGLDDLAVTGCKTGDINPQKLLLRTCLKWCKTVLIVGGLLIACGLGFWRAKQLLLVDSRANVQDQGILAAQANRDFLDIIDADSKHLYIFDIYANPASINSAFTFWEIRDSEYCTNRFDLGGWDPRHPYYVNLLSKYGITNPVKALFERTDVYSTYSSRLLVYLQNVYDSRITASGTMSIGDVQFAQYTLPIDDSLIRQDTAKTSFINEFYCINSYSGDWYISAKISDYHTEERIFYCNVSVNETRYTYRLHCDGQQLSGILYGIGNECDLNTAQIRLFEQDASGYTEYISVPPHEINLLPCLVDAFDCQVTEVETGVMISDTGIDSQLQFAIPELDEWTVVGIKIIMETQSPSIARMYIATKDVGYCEELSFGTSYDAGYFSYTFPNLADYITMLRFDPTMESDQSLLITSIQLLVIDSDLTI